jgi:hypothetical protein
VSAKTANDRGPTDWPGVLAVAGLLLVSVLLIAGCATATQQDEPGDGVGTVKKDRERTSTSREDIPWDGSRSGIASTKPAAAVCGSKDVRLDVAWRRPANDVVIGVLTIVNQGTEPCLLAVTPSVRLLDGDQVLGTSRPPTPKTAVGGATELVLKPGGTARSDIWWSEWCADTPEAIAVQLRPSRGAAPLRTDPIRVTPPPCTGGGGSVLEAKQFQLPDEDGGVLYADATTLKIQLDLPNEVASGAELKYRVILSNQGRWTVRLEPCPNFRDQLQLPVEGNEEQGWTTSSKDWLRLNCASLGGRLSPGDSASFLMETQIPDGTPSGFAQLRWTLEANNRTIREEEQFLIG